MKLLSKDLILRAEDMKTEHVSVPEWGGEVIVRCLTGVERDEFEATIMERRGRQTVMNVANARAKLIVKCIIDEDGRRLFHDGDADALGRKNAAAVDRIYQVAARLAGLTDEDIEEMVEDFGPAATDGNGSATTSPNGSAAADGDSSPKQTAGS